MIGEKAKELNEISDSFGSWTRNELTSCKDVRSEIITKSRGVIIDGRNKYLS